jgi:DNA replication protein
MTDAMQGFAGFPAGKQPTIPLPHQFFTDLLPAIDNLAELKVTLHLLWVVGRKPGRMRYARLDELLADEKLVDGLKSGHSSGEAMLRDGLERAVVRGTLLHALVERGTVTEEWYLINGPHGREVMEKLRTGQLELMAEVAEDVQLQMERPNIFVLYEQNIGLLTPMIADQLRDAEQHYPPDWIRDAFREAASLNKRNWRYVLRILERWRAEGKTEPATEDDERDAGQRGPGRRRSYIPKGYEGLVEH